MREVNVWESGFNKLITYINNIDDVINYIKESKKTSFSVIDEKGLQDGSITTWFMYTLDKQAKEQNISINYTDHNHQFFYDNLNNMYFSKSFFNESCVQQKD